MTCSGLYFLYMSLMVFSILTVVVNGRSLTRRWYSGIYENVTWECTQPGPMCSSCNQVSICVLNEYENGTFFYQQLQVDTCEADEGCSHLTARCMQRVGECYNGIKFRCHNQGIFPDPYDCNVYYSCGPPPKSLDPVVEYDFDKQYFCPWGSAFNAETEECDLEDDDDICVRRPVPPCEHLLQTGSLEANPNIYYSCVNVSGRLQPKLFRCEANETFDADSFVCRNEQEPNKSTITSTVVTGATTTSAGVATASTTTTTITTTEPTTTRSTTTEPTTTTTTTTEPTTTTTTIEPTTTTIATEPTTTTTTTTTESTTTTTTESTTTTEPTTTTTTTTTEPTTTSTITTESTTTTTTTEPTTTTESTTTEPTTTTTTTTEPTTTTTTTMEPTTTTTTTTEPTTTTTTTTEPTTTTTTTTEHTTTTTTTTEPTTTTTTTTTEPTTTTESTTTTTEPTTTTPGSTTIGVFRCTSVGSFPDPEDCRRYYRCSRATGEPLHQTCIFGHFNVETRGCDWGDC